MLTLSSVAMVVCTQNSTFINGALDSLTYTFAEELRNDLLPAVESKYSTYAKECTPRAFAQSRDHRAFAGLSRGAVTTLHSAFCACLDYFSYFGTFSSSRTPASYLKQTIQSEAFASLPIRYYYVASGVFDFGLPNQVKDYKALLSIDARVRDGENASFDTFPMRAHTMGNWHLALYNFYKKFFKSF